MSQATPRIPKRAALPVALALLAACNASSGNAVMSVHLVDGPALEYSALNVHVLRVEIAKDGGGWITLGEPDATVDLLSLTGGVAETLVDGKSIPAGTYGQLRLVLGSGNNIVTPDGTFPLKVPSGMQSGIKLAVHFVVAPNTTKDVFIDFDAHRSIFVHEAGMSKQYILRPVVRAFDRVVTGAVVGTLTDAATKAPLPGVEVMAETLDAGTPAVARSAVTRDDGSYTLDLLPLGGAYFVVAQPRVGPVAYQAGAAGPFEITEAAPVVSSDAAFAKADATGAIAGGIAPVPTGATEFTDEVTLLGTVSVASASHAFVLRTAPGAVANGVETYGLDLLPPATYSLFVTRTITDAAGGSTSSAGPAATSTVAGGATTTTNLTAPAP